MQPIADLQFLQLAKLVVELGKGCVGIVGLGDPAVRGEAGALRQIEDAVTQIAAAARVKLRGFVIFIHQQFELAQRAVAFGARERRRQVIDDHGAGAALGLRALARIVDDEGIEMRQRPQHRLGIAGIAQGQCLARQPFQIPMLAEMHDRVDLRDLPQIGVEGEVVVRWHQFRIVIRLDRIDVVAARRLDADENVAEPDQRQAKGTIGAVRILIGCAPARGDTIGNPSQAQIVFPL